MIEGLTTNEIQNVAPVVSVCVQSYQHVEYIEQCLKSILAQKTTFEFEIILGEDDSTDGTREICEEYALKYPDKIKLFLRNRADVIFINGKATGRFNFIQNILASKGKYIAICESDDYWTDPLKLQKQFDLMEKNPEFGICFHKVKELNTFDNTKNKELPEIVSDTIYEITDYILSNKTATCSIFFKKSLFEPVPDWFYKLPFGDLGIVLLVMQRSNGKGIVLNDEMGVYRVHAKGIHGSMKKDARSLINAYQQHIEFTEIMRKEFFTDGSYEKLLIQKVINTLVIIRNHYRELGSFTGYMSSSLKLYYYKALNKLGTA